jgi:hypothetical protein
MVLEVNVASICASVPIFWPVIRPFLGVILVTREFSVKDEIRIRREEAAISSSGHGAASSETELNTYYEDAYAMDALGFKVRGDMENQVRTEIRGQKTKTRGRR